MIKHVYLIKLKDPARARGVADRLLGMRDAIPEILDMEVGLDFRGTPTSYDVCEICTFATREDFEVFGRHPRHQQIRDYIDSVQQQIAKADYELPD